MADNVVKLKPGSTRPFGFFPSQLLERPPPPQWLIDGFAMRGTVTLLAGEGKVGKSYLLQQLLSSVALGIPSIGRHCEKARTFGYFCEDSQNWLATRQFDINEALGVLTPDYEQNYSWESRAAEPCTLAEFEYGRMKLTTGIADGCWRMLWEHVTEEESELVGIDTARAVFAGNEVAANQVTPFMRALQGEAIRRNICIILVVHPPKKGDPRGFAGTGAWLNSARSGWSLHRPPEYDEETGEPRDERILANMGANYSARQRPDRLVFRDGIFHATDAPPPRVPITSIDKMDLDYRGLAGMKRVLANGGKIPADEAHALSMPNRARRSPDLKDVPYNALYEMQARLLERGQAVRVRVTGRCLIRPADGPPYAGEEPWG